MQSLWALCLIGLSIIVRTYGINRGSTFIFSNGFGVLYHNKTIDFVVHSDSSPPPSWVSMSNVKTIVAAGYYGTAILYEDGTCASWGYQYSPKKWDPDLTDFVEISVSSGPVFAGLRLNGELVVWGKYNIGKLNKNKFMLTDIKKIYKNN